MKVSASSSVVTALALPLRVIAPLLVVLPSEPALGSASVPMQWCSG